MKISTRRDALFAQLQTVTRAASTRSAVQALSGVQLPARTDGAIELRATDMEIGLRVPLEGEVVRDGADRPAGAPARRRRARAARRRGRRSSCAPAEQDVEIVAAPRRSTSARCARRTSRRFPEPEGDGRVEVPGAGVRGDRAEGRPLGVARRDAPDPHRHPRVGRRRRAADGRDRLLPAVGEGDAAGGAAGGLVRGQRAGAGAAGAHADRRSTARRRRRSRSACAPTRSCSRPAASCCRRG